MQRGSSAAAERRRGVALDRWLWHRWEMHDHDVEILMLERMQSIEDKLDWLIGITRHEVHAMSTIDTAIQNLTDRVTAEGSVVSSTLTLIQGMAQQIIQLRDQLGTDPERAAAKLNDLALALQGQADALTAAVTANTGAQTTGTTSSGAAGSTDNGSTNGNETPPVPSQGQGPQGASSSPDGRSTPQG